ncbi:hypothetical protein MSAN_00194500 [Mycena sanguinolenta]|uniref:F-box domain-containing protein n=1 Tax=Mycena sanguinolenta TaxID=230812 RepID=A0A8H6ZEV8_9AGAR|nr:hypothetical protein MSAN_00194500 [Mycena sanguinolenta]
MTITIPQELIEAILEHLDPVGHRNLLKSVALLSTAFVGPVQAILFRRLYLQSRRTAGNNWSLTFERALDIFDTSPHLMSHVKDMTLVLPLKDFPAHDAQLERLLPKCIAVRRLVLTGLALSWDTLSSDLQSALSAFFRHAECLEKLHIMGIAAVPQYVFEIAAQRCSVLSLHGPLTKKADGIPPTGYGHLSLEHLILSTDSFEPGSHQGLMVPAFIGSLRRLTIERTSFISNYVRAVESTLTELSLDCTLGHEDFTLPPLPRLRLLELKVLPRPRTLMPPWVPSTLTQLLAVLPMLHTFILKPRIWSSTQTLLPEATALMAAFDETMAMSGTLAHCVWDLVLRKQGADHGTYRTILERNLVSLFTLELIRLLSLTPIISPPPTIYPTSLVLPRLVLLLFSTRPVLFRSRSLAGSRRAVAYLEREEEGFKTRTKTQDPSRLIQDPPQDFNTRRLNFKTRLKTVKPSSRLKSFKCLKTKTVQAPNPQNA